MSAPKTLTPPTRSLLVRWRHLLRLGSWPASVRQVLGAERLPRPPGWKGLPEDAAAAAVAALAVAAALLAAGGGDPTAAPAASSAAAPRARAPVVRLFPAAGQGASGFSPFGETASDAAPGDAPPELLWRSTADGAGEAAAQAVFVPVSTPEPQPAVAVERVQITVRPPDPGVALARPRVWLRTEQAGTPGWWTRTRLAGSCGTGTGRTFDLEPLWLDGARGALTGLRIESGGGGRGSFALDLVEVWGRPRAGQGGFRLFTDAGRTRRVWQGPGGARLELRGRLPEGGRLVGEVALHPDAAGLAGPFAADVVVTSPGRRDRIERRIPLAPDPAAPAWASYEVPLAQRSGGEIAVSLSLAGPSGATALWSEPLLVRGPAGPGRGLVLISVGGLRADAVFPPAGAAAMPRLAARAQREGQVFQHHYAASNRTLPSQASLFTGRYPSSHHAGDDDAFIPVRPELPLRLAQDGIFTAALVDGSVSAAQGFALGFDRYEERGERPFAPEQQGWAYHALRPQLQGRDFFLFVHSDYIEDYAEPPQLPPADLPAAIEDYRRAHERELVAIRGSLRDGRQAAIDPRYAPLMRALYRERARRFDLWLDGFLDVLARDFRDAPPVVVVTSDHGEAFGEGPDGRTWHHGGSLDEVEVQVPLVVFHSDRRPRRPVTAPTSHVDLLPTLLRLAGAIAPAGGSAGVDLFDAAALAARREVYVEDVTGARSAWAAIGRTLKLVRTASLAGPRPRADAGLLFHGGPGRFDAAPAAPARGPEVHFLEQRRLEMLQATVDGLVLRFDNPGRDAGVVELSLALDAADAIGELAGPSPLQVYLLEPDDAIAVDEAGGGLRASLALPPGDTDLLVVSGAAPFETSLAARGAPLRVSLAGKAAAADGRLLLGRTITPALSSAPAPLPGRGLSARIWTNAPADGGP